MSDEDGDGISESRADVLATYDYYPYGGLMPGRVYNPTESRYGWNGQERSDEIAGVGNHYTAKYWEYSPRAVHRWNRDPKPHPSFSPYAIMQGNPILNVDPLGDTIRVTTGSDKYLFTLNDGKPELQNLTAKQVYDKGLQWFEPLADNYTPLLDQANNLTEMSELKHFTWNQITDFSEVDRWMLSYRQEGSGDWKQSKEGAAGFFLITVGGSPYWSDAIGQIPFAVDKFTDELTSTGKVTQSIRNTVEAGMQYGEGKLFGGTRDESNTYDNYFILKGALWGAERYKTSGRSVWNIGKQKFYGDYKLNKTGYSPANLGSTTDSDAAEKYGIKK